MYRDLWCLIMGVCHRFQKQHLHQKQVTLQDRHHRGWMIFLFGFLQILMAVVRSSLMEAIVLQMTR